MITSSVSVYVCVVVRIQVHALNLLRKNIEIFYIRVELICTNKNVCI